MRGSAVWKPKLRWLIRRMRLFESFEASVGEAEADRGEDALAVRSDCAGELDERGELRSRRPGQPGVEVGGRERRAIGASPARVDTPVVLPPAAQDLLRKRHDLRIVVYQREPLRQDGRGRLAQPGGYTMLLHAP